MKKQMTVESQEIGDVYKGINAARAVTDMLKKAVGIDDIDGVCDAIDIVLSSTAAILRSAIAEEGTEDEK